ncbi:MAG: hypothetical protein FalmKO_28340 [Falsiruegeria mediterranea]
MIRARRDRTAHADCCAHAAPAGGARPWRGWGCAFAVLSLVSTHVVAEASLPVPSGQPIYLDNVLLDENPGELWLRFRFVAPKIGQTVGRVGYDVSAVDMDHLCETLAVPYVLQRKLVPARVVISLSDKAVAFGESAPDVTQFFEAYRLENARCIWEEF